jgi:hypothetical protein
MRSNTVGRRLAFSATVGALLSVAMVAEALGFRPDMPLAIRTAMFWVKLAYASALAGISLWALERLSRPATPASKRLLWLSLPVVVMASLCVMQLANRSGDQRLSMLMGATASVCPWRILLFSGPPFLALVWSMRGLAPTSLRRTGAVLGLCAGGLGAGAYALACTESTVLFLGAWYSLAILGVALVGWAIAPWILRW